MAVEAARNLRGSFNIIHLDTGFKADIYLSGRDALHHWAFSRARRMDIAGEPLSVAPPEYVIIRKLEFFREGGSEKHLRDFRAMLEAEPDLVSQQELNDMIAERGLLTAWRKTREALGQ